MSSFSVGSAPVILSTPSVSSLTSGTLSAPPSVVTLSSPSVPSIATEFEPSLNRDSSSPFSMGQQPEVIYLNSSPYPPSRRASSDSPGIFYTPPTSRYSTPVQQFYDNPAHWSSTSLDRHDVSQTDFSKVTPSTATEMKSDAPASAPSSASTAMYKGQSGSAFTEQDRVGAPPSQQSLISATTAFDDADKMGTTSERSAAYDLLGTAGLVDSAIETSSDKMADFLPADDLAASAGVLDSAQKTSISELDKMTLESTATGFRPDYSAGVLDEGHRAEEDPSAGQDRIVDSARTYTEGDHPMNVIDNAHKTVAGSTSFGQDRMTIPCSASPTQEPASHHVADETSRGPVTEEPHPTLNIHAVSPLSAVIQGAERMRVALDRSELPTEMREGNPDTLGRDKMDTGEAPSMFRSETATTPVGAQGGGEKMDDITAQPNQASRTGCCWDVDTARTMRDTLISGASAVKGWIPDRVSEWKNTAASRIPSRPEWNLRERAAEWRSVLPSKLPTGITDARERLTSKFSGWERPNPKAYLSSVADRLHGATIAFGDLKSRFAPITFESSKGIVPPRLSTIDLPQSAVSSAAPSATTRSKANGLLSRFTSGLSLPNFGKHRRGTAPGWNEGLSPERSAWLDKDLKEKQDHVSGALKGLVDPISAAGGSVEGKDWKSSVLRYLDEISMPAEPVTDLQNMWKDLSTVGGRWLK